MHLIIDGYSNDSNTLQSVGFITELLDQYPAEIGMTKISRPYVLRYVGTKPEEWGVSGFVLIAESHISIHTFVERCYVNVDVFSCKNFDADRVIKDLTNRLQLTGVTTHLLGRGVEDLERAGDIASLQSR